MLSGFYGASSLVGYVIASGLVAFFSLPQYHIANYSLRSLLVFYDLPARLVDAATLLLALVWAIGAWRLRADRQRCYAFTLGASLLMSPIVWRNYFLLGIPIAILLYGHVRSQSIVVRLIYAVGVLANGRHVFVVFTIREREGARLIRAISARFMHEKEIRRYEATKQNTP